MVKRLLTIVLILVSGLSLSQSYTVEELIYNGKGDMYAPAFYKTTLVVCSNKKNSIKKTIIDLSQKEPIDLYTVSFTNGDSINVFNESINTNYNDGPICFNREGNEFVISRNLKTSKKNKDLQNDRNHLGLYHYSIDSNGVNLIQELPFNSSEYNCSHPSLNEKGDVLYFSSNMPGGSGGFDIWKSTKQNNIWGLPVNLGPKVNSGKNEVFPSILNNDLYFSLDNGVYGGLDLYSFNTKDTNQIATVLPEPMNSEFDDFTIVSKDDFSSGYFSSNRDGADRIYSFDFVYPTFNDCDSIKATYFCYEFFEESSEYIQADSVTLQPLIYRWRINNEVIDGAKIEYCFPTVGQYEVYLDVVDTIFKQTYKEQSYFYIDIQNEVQPYITSKDTVKLGEPFALSGEETYLPDVEISKYFWLIDDVGMYKGMKTEHTFMSEGNHQVKLGIIDKEGNKYCVYKTIYCAPNTEN